MCGFYSKLRAGIFEKYIYNFDIICLSETKLIEISNLELMDFKIYNHPKVGNHGLSVLVTKY